MLLSLLSFSTTGSGQRRAVAPPAELRTGVVQISACHSICWCFFLFCFFLPQNRIFQLNFSSFYLHTLPISVPTQSTATFRLKLDFSSTKNRPPRVLVVVVLCSMYVLRDQVGWNVCYEWYTERLPWFVFDDTTGYMTSSLHLLLHKETMAELS